MDVLLSTETNKNVLYVWQREWLNVTWQIMKIDNKYTVKSTNVALIFFTHSIGPCKIIIDRFDNLAYYILTPKQENIEETIIIL